MASKEEREPLLADQNDHESPPPDYTPYPSNTTVQGLYSYLEKFHARGRDDKINVKDFKIEYDLQIIILSSSESVKFLY